MSLHQRQALLILGALRILGRGVVFDDIADFVGVSEYVVRDFFFVWIKHWSTVKFAHYVKMPTTEAELRRCEAEYAMGGLSGCIGSSDVCHVAWDRCRASMSNAATGKEGFPTLAFQIIVNHRRRILHSTGAFLGATNDKSIARLDPAFTEIHEGSGCARDFKFNLFDSRGRTVEHKGAYLLVDGGYHKWSVLMDPIHRPTSRTEKDWTENLESFRKDVECTFGILKGRWRILKSGIRLQKAEHIVRIWKTCCALHNMLLEVCW